MFGRLTRLPPLRARSRFCRRGGLYGRPSAARPHRGRVDEDIDPYNFHRTRRAAAIPIRLPPNAAHSGRPYMPPLQGAPQCSTAPRRGGLAARGSMGTSTPTRCTRNSYRTPTGAQKLPLRTVRRGGFVLFRPEGGGIIPPPPLGGVAPPGTSGPPRKKPTPPTRNSNRRGPLCSFYAGGLL